MVIENGFRQCVVAVTVGLHIILITCGYETIRPLAADEHLGSAQLHFLIGLLALAGTLSLADWLDRSFPIRIHHAPIRQIAWKYNLVALCVGGLVITLATFPAYWDSHTERDIVVVLGWLAALLLLLVLGIRFELQAGRLKYEEMTKIEQLKLG